MQRSRSRKQALMLAYLRSGKARGGIDIFKDIKAAAAPLGYDVQLIDPGTLDTGQRLMDMLYHRGYLGFSWDR
jgi:hypothetical protein